MKTVNVVATIIEQDGKYNGIKRINALKWMIAEV
jgi:hypothetical protein